MPQSNFPLGEFQSERLEDIIVAEFAAAVRPKRLGTAPRSMKLWLRFAKAEDLEFMTAAATAADVSNPYEVGFLAGEDERLATGPSNSISKSKSLAQKAVFSLLPGCCRAGGVRPTLFCHKPPLLGDEEAVTKGDIGGVEVPGSDRDDDPRANELKVAMSTALDVDLGEGIAEPVAAYTGRNSSGLCAKKHTFRAQPVSSLQSRGKEHNCMGTSLGLSSLHSLLDGQMDTRNLDEGAKRSPGLFPLPSTLLGSADASSKSLTTPTDESAQPATAQWRAVTLSEPHTLLTSTLPVSMIYFKTRMLPNKAAIMRGVLSSKPIFFNPFLLPYQWLASSISKPFCSTSILKPARSSAADNSSKTEHL
ncbi:hypothetical protein SADUNF_Sadunf10G0143700 [Salix dunnii]|uniref:Uncharacterized protein n=1 Tax=Salix dunnii TaxID=1413687 RepID=A0A835JU62_9ROSI|nr:hypothetical protein SADUNF_Sadunf10G0143700 [Salix dunnii]